MAARGAPDTSDPDAALTIPANHDGQAAPAGLEAGGRAAPDSTAERVRDEGRNRSVDLGRIAWLVTVLSCLLAVAILIPQGYYGYAGVTFAVAVAAAINLT